MKELKEVSIYTDVQLGLTVDNRWHAFLYALRLRDANPEHRRLQISTIVPEGEESRIYRVGVYDVTH